ALGRDGELPVSVRSSPRLAANAARNRGDQVQAGNGGAGGDRPAAGGMRGFRNPGGGAGARVDPRDGPRPGGAGQLPPAGEGGGRRAVAGARGASEKGG